MDSILNAAAYCFTPVADPTGLRDTLHQQAKSQGLKGSLLLAPEGINLFLAGQADTLRAFFNRLQQDSRFAAMPVKWSWSATQPFRKLQAKVKREIIRMNQPALQPAAGRAPSVDALTLRRWLSQGHDDQGRPVRMLDTRNAFEVDCGRFDGALDWRIHQFTDFPHAFEQHREELQGQTVVSYCTGGIRCEKAALYMRSAGLDHVLQLDGGILGYFEQAGGAHFSGHCFVFDERVALDQDLRPAVKHPGADRSADSEPADAAGS